MTDKLLPCPFCGSKANSLSQRGERKLIRYHAVVCSKACQIYSTDIENAIIAWNTRVKCKNSMLDICHDLERENIKLLDKLQHIKWFFDEIKHHANNGHKEIAAKWLISEIDRINKNDR